MEWAVGAMGRPFAWGETDCALICFEAFDAITGLSLAAQHRGQWSDEESARRFQTERATDLQRTLMTAGCVEVRPGFQQRGDFILHDAAPFVAGVVCLGRHCTGVARDEPVRQWRTAAALAAAGARILRAP